MSNSQPSSSVASKTARILKMRESQYGIYVPEVFAIPAHQGVTWKKGHYRPGDGDHTAQPQRPGSDHRHLKSHGTLT